MSKSFNQFLKYAIVGVVGLVVEFAVYLILKNYFGVYYVYAHVVGVIFAMVNNFILNSIFTFKATDKVFMRAASYFGFASIGLIGGTFMLPTVKNLIMDIYAFSNISFISLTESDIEDISKLSITAFVATVQFFFNKFFTFRKKNTLSNP